ncbi:MAG: acetyltransferase [Planctomycetes bacterium]|nr:acetyltransferase [Planctomycetota bacterium]
MKKDKRLVIIGAGGFGQEIIWAVRNINALRSQYEILGYCDDDPAKKGSVIYSATVLGTPEAVDKILPVKPSFICAIGDNVKRAKVVKYVLSLGWLPATVIDPSVIIAEGVSVGEGTYVGAGCILSPYAQIGNHVIINHHCSIGHNSVLDDFVQISPGGRVSGSCRVKEGASLGSNAVIAPGITVGRFATLGASSFAMTDIPDDVTAIGTPARVVLRHKHMKSQ